jgi:hypothetical protein
MYVSEASMQGLWVVGIFFGLAFLMVVGLHSVLRELFVRGPYPAYSPARGDDADDLDRSDDGLIENREGNFEEFDRENESMSVQAPRV